MVLNTRHYQYVVHLWLLDDDDDGTNAPVCVSPCSKQGYIERKREMQE